MHAREFASSFPQKMVLKYDPNVFWDVSSTVLLTLPTLLVFRANTAVCNRRQGE